MRIFIRHNKPRVSQFSLLVPDDDLGLAPFPGGMGVSMERLEKLVSHFKAHRQSQAKNCLMSSAPILWIGRQKLPVIRFANTTHRVTWSESQRNGLKSQEWLLGLTFTFIENKDAAKFKLVWDNTGKGVTVFN